MCIAQRWMILNPSGNELATVTELADGVQEMTDFLLPGSIQQVHFIMFMLPHRASRTVPNSKQISATVTNVAFAGIWPRAEGTFWEAL